MLDKSAHSERLRALVESQRFAVLSTRQDDGHPYASLVAFVVSEDLRQWVFCTLRSTRKFANLEAEGRVAMLIDNRSSDEKDLQEASAATVLGTCAEARGEARSTLSDWFLSRHPAMTDFVRSPECAVIKVEVRAYYLVTHFQEVVELQVAQGERGETGADAV